MTAACSGLQRPAAAIISCRNAFAFRHGHRALTLRGAMPRETTVRQRLCADIDRSDLHAAVRVEAHNRKRLEQLCRYTTRIAPSDEQVQLNAAGKLPLELKTPWRDGTTYQLTSPLGLMQSLSALVLRPRLRLTS